jgi:hypothetical protein
MPQMVVTAVRSSTTPGRSESGFISNVLMYGGNVGRDTGGIAGDGGNSKVGNADFEDSFLMCVFPPIAGTKPL